jgi:hypothetical protein
MPALSAQLLFGLSRPDGRTVTDGAWRRFLAARIAPRFPNGLTVTAAEGRWRQSNGRPRAERSRIVLIVTDDTPETRSSLDVIRAEYRAAFAQESVGLVLSRVCASFR